MSNNNYLYNQLVEINKQYESTSFVDIDIIDLFNIRSIDISNAKKLVLILNLSNTAYLI